MTKTPVSMRRCRKVGGSSIRRVLGRDVAEVPGLAGPQFHAPGEGTTLDAPAIQEPEVVRLPGDQSFDPESAIPTDLEVGGGPVADQKDIPRRRGLALSIDGSAGQDAPGLEGHRLRPG